MNSPAAKAGAPWGVLRIALRVTFEGAKCNQFQRSFRVVDLIQNFGDGRNEVGVENPGYFADTWSILVGSPLARTHENVGYRVMMAEGRNIPVTGRLRPVQILKERGSSPT
jgi:hypothetical protein